MMPPWEVPSLYHPESPHETGGSQHGASLGVSAAPLTWFSGPLTPVPVHPILLGGFVSALCHSWAPGPLEGP